MAELSLRKVCRRALLDFLAARRHWNRRQMSLEAHSERGCMSYKRVVKATEMSKNDALKEVATSTSAPLAPSTEALLRELRTFLPSPQAKSKGKQRPRNLHPTRPSRDVFQNSMYYPTVTPVAICGSPFFG